VLAADRPRCLYFDLDGHAKHKTNHETILGYLQQLVRWVFSGDRLGWDATCPEPVALVSADPSKYSCHVVFPQIQFASHVVQNEYLRIILDALPALEVEFEEGSCLAILEEVVDRVPYSCFQLLRGPYACKTFDGYFRLDTMLEPEGRMFRDDPLTCFASRAERGYALQLPPPPKLLEWNADLRHQVQTSAAQHIVSAERPGTANPMDLANLYLTRFQRPDGGIINLAGLTDLEIYEEALHLVHHERASQFWSWFRLSGVTYSMLQRYKGNAEKTKRIWDAHNEWSRTYAKYDVVENIKMVERCAGRRVSGLRLLEKLVCFDNPNAKVRLRSLSSLKD